MTADWSNSLALQLIELYKEHECLWKPTHDDYKNRNKKADAWKSISETLDLDIIEVKKKMESLLTSFRRERQKCETTVTTGCSPDDVYYSNWFAFKSMQFLMDKFTVRKTSNNKEHNSGEGYTQERECYENSAQEADLNIADEEPHKKTENGLPELSTEERLTEPMNSDVIPAKRLKIIQKRRPDESYKIFKYKIDNRQSRDDSTIYGEHIASKHRRYSLHTRSVVEHLISGILFNADMGRYEARTHNNRSPSPSYSPGTPPPCSVPVTSTNKQSTDFSNVTHTVFPTNTTRIQIPTKSHSSSYVQNLEYPKEEIVTSPLSTASSDIVEVEITTDL